MPTREEMHNLVEGIVASFEARTAGIAFLQREVGDHRKATQTQLSELARTHRAMARQLRTGLAQGRANLKVSVGGGSLHGLAQAHVVLTAAEARRKGEVNTWLKAVDRAHQGMAREHRDGLVRDRSQLASSVAVQLKGLDQDHQAMARQQRAELTQDEASRKAAVQALMDHVAAERAAGQKEWQRLGATIAVKRNGAAAGIGPPHAEEAMAGAEVGAVTEELTALSDRVFQYLANHPDGARLTEIEREFDLGRLQAARVVRHLTDEGKAQKRDRCYFAT